MSKIDAPALIGGLTGAAVSASGMNLEAADHLTSIICAVIGVAIAIVSGIVIPLLRWWKKAKEDGKITVDEALEAAEIVSKGLEGTKDAMEGKEKENDSQGK